MIDKFDGKYRWLSNFWLCPVILDEMVFPSVESAYQAAKTQNINHRVNFLYCSPGKAKRMGRALPEVADDWNASKQEVMNKLLKQKFREGSFLGEKLIDTGNDTIIEGNTWGDRYWGVCNGEGENNLGKLLMNIRMELVVKMSSGHMLNGES